MNALLWILQALLALMFLWHGWLFLAPPAEMAAQMNAFIPAWFRLFIGAAEVVAAIALIVPGLTRVQPKLTPAAAAGLMIVTFSASVLHLTRGETASAVTTAVLFLLLAVVAYGRWRVRPIAPRSAAGAPAAVSR